MNEQVDPVDVWELHDYLVETVVGIGMVVAPFSILTDSARDQARMWFRLRQAARHTNLEQLSVNTLYYATYSVVFLIYNAIYSFKGLNP